MSYVSTSWAKVIFLYSKTSVYVIKKDAGFWGLIFQLPEQFKSSFLTLKTGVYVTKKDKSCWCIIFHILEYQYYLEYFKGSSSKFQTNFIYFLFMGALPCCRSIPNYHNNLDYVDIVCFLLFVVDFRNKYLCFICLNL